jgi:hypothetical protein
MTRLLILALAALCTTACVHPMPTGSWRLANNILTPPKTPASKIVERTVQAEAGGKVCPPGIRIRRKHATVKVTGKMLSSRQPGWLTAWAEDLEAQDCIAQGEALPFANDIAESLPLEMNAAFRLLHPSEPYVVAIGPGVRLQIMTPIVADGTAPGDPLIETETATLDGNTLTVDARFTAAVLGYEVTWYSAQPRAHLPGVSITPFSTERHLNGDIDHPSSPIVNYFKSLSSASFYVLFYKGGQTEFTALIVGGNTKAELDQRIKLLETGPASCAALNNQMCVTVPKRAAINPMVHVTINGAEKFLNWGATVGAAIRSAGEQQVNTVLPRLQIQKPYRDRLVPLEFDGGDPAILTLILMGEETISWK